MYNPREWSVIAHNGKVKLFTFKINNMSTMTIKRVKLVKEKTMEIGYDKTENGKDIHVTEKHPGLVHNDLKTALANLRVHLGLLTELIPISEVRSIGKVNEKLLENLQVTGYSIGGKPEDEGVVITGFKKLSNGKTVTLNTPFTRFEDGEEAQYKYIDKLIKDIEVADGEVQQYIDGKVAPDPQTEMNFNAGEEN